MDRPDVDLAQAWAQRGDRDAFHTLYTRHAAKVYAFARHLSGRTDVAEDVVQETFLRAGRAMGAFRNQARLDTWLLTIARNALHDQGRRQARRDRDAERETQPHHNPTPPQIATQNERERLVREAVLRLPEDQRLAVTLCNLQDLPLKEAAMVLSWRLEKLKSVLFRARQRLKQELARYMEA